MGLFERCAGRRAMFLEQFENPLPDARRSSRGHDSVAPVSLWNSTSSCIALPRFASRVGGETKLTAASEAGRASGSMPQAVGFVARAGTAD